MLQKKKKKDAEDDEEFKDEGDNEFDMVKKLLKDTKKIKLK